ncbi:MAG: hypothetical protein ACJ76M_16930, partial [Solirubrobacteraceae bacterium]
MAPTLKAAGLTVFTAPEGPGATPPAPCSGGGPLPPRPAGDILSGPRGMQARCGARSMIGDNPPGIPQFVIAPIGRCART